MAIQFSGIESSASVIIYVIAAVLIAFVIKSLLDKLRMFRSSTVNWLLSFVVAFSGIYFAKIPIATLTTITAISIFAICALKISGVKGFLIGIAAAVVYFVFALPFLLRFLGL